MSRFYRVQRLDSVSGRGRGLPVCKGIVAAHDGPIMAQNRDGGGIGAAVALPSTASGERMP